MAIPISVTQAANKYASLHGGSLEVYSAFVDGWQHAQKEKKAKIKEAVLNIDDEYTFDRWWEMYDKKKSKEKCLEKWANMSYDERKAAIERTPLYVAMTSEVRFRKDPLTWLNQRCWGDEYTGGLPQRLDEADPDKFLEYFNKHFEYTDIPKLSEMTETRKRLLNVIYTLYRNDILPVLNKVLESSYLTGESGKRRPITFEEIFELDMFVRIKDGYYDERR